MLRLPLFEKFLTYLFLIGFILTSPPMIKGQCLAKTFSAVVVATKDYGPYKVCTNGIEKGLKAIFPRVTIKIFSLITESPFKISNNIKEIKPDIIFGVGTRACLFLDELDLKALVVFTFIIDNTLKTLNKHTFAAVSLDVPTEKKLAILCQIIKRPKVGMFSTTIYKEKIQNLHLSCCKGNIKLIVSPFVNTVIELALKKMANSDINSFLITPDPIIYKNQEVVKYTLLWGFLNRIAICGLSKGYVKNGALFALEADIEALGNQTAKLGKLLIEGKIKEKRYIEHPEKLVLSINLKTARRLGIKIPKSLLDKAKFIVK